MALSDIVISDIVRLRKEGRPIWKIAELLGVSANSVQRFSKPERPLGFTCGKCGHRGHKASYCRTDPSLHLERPKRVSRAEPNRCTSCDKPGHKRDRCPSPAYVGLGNPGASAYARRHRAKRLCTSCPRPALPGKSKCEKCSSKPRR